MTFPKPDATIKNIWEILFITCLFYYYILKQINHTIFSGH